MSEPTRNRHSLRLKDYDYALPGAYFVTLVTQNRVNRFGKIQNGFMIFNDIGGMLEICWLDLLQRFPGIVLDEYVIMPNHFHGIILIADKPVGAAPVAARSAKDAPGAGTSPAPTNHTLGDVVGAFKSIATHQYIIGVKQSGWPTFDHRLWQRNYYERIIRNETELQKIRQYIYDNPLQWELDEENTEKLKP